MNKTADYTFTVLVPFYNEEDNIYRLEDSLKKFLEKSLVPDTAVLFVNDGSRDNGQKLVEEICARNEHFYYISLAQNTGLSGALKAGFDNCYSKYVGYIDADLQTSPMDFNLLLPYVEEYPLVMGIRANRKDSFFKNLVQNRQRFPADDDPRQCHRHGMPAQDPADGLCQENPHVHRHAPVLPRPDPIAGRRHHEAGPGQPFSPYGGRIQIPFMEPADSSF